VALITPFKASALMQSQLDAGAKIFSWSWGVMDSDYNSQARDIDEFLYQNPDIVVVVAAGNAGSEGSKSISSPGGCKNVITVGASLSAAESFNDCQDVLNPDSVASFSSTGPTSDGRLKPDIVAPGEIITSAESAPPDRITERTSSTCDLQGTSQAAPAVAGLAAMLRQWLVEGWWKSGKPDPTFAITTVPSSLIKALLIHSGTSLQRKLRTLQNSRFSNRCSQIRSDALSLNSYPDYHQGYGRPQIDKITGLDGQMADVHFLPNSTRRAPVINHGGEHIFNVSVSPGSTLRVTIAWTDPPGSLSSSRLLQHDLDLMAFVPGLENIMTWYPLSGSNGGYDRSNNVEMITVPYADVQDLYIQNFAEEVAGTNNLNANDSISDGTSNPDLPNFEGPLLVTVKVRGESVLGGYQEYSIVKSAGMMDGAQLPGNLVEDSDEGSFDPRSGGTGSGFSWEPWMTYTAISIIFAMLLIVYGCWLRRATKRKSARARSRTLDQSAMHYDDPIATVTPSTAADSSSIYTAIPVPSDMASAPPQPLSASELETGVTAASFHQDAMSNTAVVTSEDGCPFCAFSSRDPVALVRHVETNHQE